MQRVFEIDDLNELRDFLAGRADVEKAREWLFGEFAGLAVGYASVDEWNRAVRLCECLAMTGWGNHEPVEAVAGVYVNGNPETFFVNRNREPRFFDAVWSKRKNGLAIDFGKSVFYESQDAPAVGSLGASERQEAVGEVCAGKLLSQRNWIAKNPICLTRGIANCYENSRAVIHSMENSLMPLLDARMRPELYGDAINRIVLNCSFSYYDNYHCKTNYIIADEALGLRQSDFHQVLSGMFPEQEIKDNGYYLRNRFSLGSFRKDSGTMRVVIVFEKAFSELPHGEQKRLLCGYILQAVQRIEKRLSAKIRYNFALLVSDLVSVLDEWMTGE